MDDDDDNLTRRQRRQKMAAADRITIRLDGSKVVVNQTLEALEEQARTTARRT